MQVRSNFLFAEVIHQPIPIFAFDDVKVHGMFFRVLALRQGKREVAKGQIVLIGDPPSLLVVFGQVLELDPQDGCLDLVQAELKRSAFRL